MLTACRNCEIQGKYHMKVVLSYTDFENTFIMLWNVANTIILLILGKTQF